MTVDTNTVADTNLAKRLLAALLQEKAIVLVVDRTHNTIVDYRIEPVADVAARLAINGFGVDEPITTTEEDL